MSSGDAMAHAAAAIAGMVKFPPATESAEDKPLVAATMFGVTTPCIQRAQEVLEEAGYEVLVFHANGSGGQAMESLIGDGVIAGVLDITTTELADEIVGGVLSAGPDRLTAAAASGVPQVVSVGATDMVNFSTTDSVPAEFKTRKLHRHNDNVTLMRTTADESVQVGVQLAGKLAKSTGPMSVFLPLRGVSAIDKAGQPFEDLEARESLFRAVRAGLAPEHVVELDYHINDIQFAEAAAKKLIELMTT